MKDVFCIRNWLNSFLIHSVFFLWLVFLALLIVLFVLNWNPTLHSRHCIFYTYYCVYNILSCLIFSFPFYVLCLWNVKFVNGMSVLLCGILNVVMGFTKNFLDKMYLNHIHCSSFQSFLPSCSLSPFFSSFLFSLLPSSL